MNSHPDDTFQLYDLRVELICPEGERILCGAKPGDHFTLQGEMLHLPPGQGISIYSLGTFCFHSQNSLFLDPILAPIDPQWGSLFFSPPPMTPNPLLSSSDPSQT